MPLSQLSPFVMRASTLQLRERGVILIITLIMLVVTSSIAALAIKGTSSTEAIANNSRTQGMAMQIAEAALRYCVAGVSNNHETTRAVPARPGLPAPNNHTWPILPAPVGGATPTWANITGWQGATIASIVVPLITLDNQGSLVAVADGPGNPGSYSSSYRRPPDCIAQDAVSAGGNRVVEIVARGFGPEVADAPVGNPGEIPAGTEVFLQATVRLAP